jgi:hypothetical protein
VSIGQSFKYLSSLMPGMEEVIVRIGIQLRELEDTSERISQEVYLLSARLGQIICLRRDVENRWQLSLTFPKRYALNPVLWLFAFYLSHRFSASWNNLGARQIHRPL